MNSIIDAVVYSYVMAFWVPWSLTDCHKTVQKGVSSDSPPLWGWWWKLFLSVVIGDETRIHHLELQTRGQSLEWHHPTSRKKKKFNVTPSVGKVMATIFWDAEGLILVVIVLYGQAISSDLYIQTLKNFAEVFQESLISKKFCWNPSTWQHMTTHKSGNIESSYKAQTDCSCSPTIQPRSRCRRVPPLWSPQRCHAWEEVGDWWS